MVEGTNGTGRRGGGSNVSGDKVVADCGSVAVCAVVGSWKTDGGGEPTYLIVTTSPTVTTTVSVATSIRTLRRLARGALRRSLGRFLS
jgi:hypothetical protein